jgi:hypothetical protein
MLVNFTVRDVPLEGAAGRLVREAVFNGLDAETYGENLIAEQRANYREAGRSAEDGVSGGSWNWEYAETVEGAKTDEYLAVSREREYYQGGAHGMREKRYFMFDTENGARLSLDDVVRGDGRARLRALIAGRLRDHAGIGQDAPLTQGGFFSDEAEVTENFFLTPSGVGFHWDPYEIAPYVMGGIEVIIPYTELKDILL